MYLIENGRGYSIKDDKAYKITFGIDGKMKIDEEDFIEVEGKPRYTYNELMAKLNVKYMLEQAKAKANKSKDESEGLKSLKEENEQLVKELEDKNNKIAELELQIEELLKSNETNEELKKDDEEESKLLIPKEENEEQEKVEENEQPNEAKENKKK